MINMPPTGTNQKTHPMNGMRLRTRIALCVFLSIAAVFLLTEHWQHVWPLLPYALLLACPVMHLFHHHGHGGHDMPHDADIDQAKLTKIDNHEDRH